MLPLVSTDTHATDECTRSIIAKPGCCKNNNTNPKNQIETEAASCHSVATNKSPVTWETVSRCRTLVSLFRDYLGGGIWQTLHRGLGDRNRDS